MEHLSALFGEEYDVLRRRVIDIASAQGSGSYVIPHSSRLALASIVLKSICCSGDKIIEYGFSNLLHYLIDADLDAWDYTSFPDPGDCYHPYTRPGICANEANIAHSLEAVVNIEDDPLPLPDSLYDVAVSTEVIEHMDVDPMFYMCEVNRTLKLGGRLFLTTPNSSSNRIIHKVLSGSQPSFYMLYSKTRNPYKHNFEYSPDLLRRLLEAAGFCDISLSTYDTFDKPVPIVDTWLKQLNFSLEYRGDNIFATATKVSSPIDRYPLGIYD